MSLEYVHTKSWDEGRFASRNGESVLFLGFPLFISPLFLEVSEYSCSTTIVFFESFRLYKMGITWELQKIMGGLGKIRWFFFRHRHCAYRFLFWFDAVFYILFFLDGWLVRVALAGNRLALYRIGKEIWPLGTIFVSTAAAIIIPCFQHPLVLFVLSLFSFTCFSVRPARLLVGLAIGLPRCFEGLDPDRFVEGSVAWDLTWLWR